MEEFLKENYSVLTKLVEILAAVTALLMLKKYKATAVKYFIYFLVFVVFIELVGYYPSFLKDSGRFNLIEGTLIERNFWWYTLTWAIGSACFYSFYFEQIISTNKHKSVLKILRFSFIIFSAVFIAFNWQNFFTKSMPVITIIGAILVLLGAILYFIDMLRSEKILSFFKSINFYISATVFIWFLITTPIVFYNVYFSTADWNFIILKWQLYLSANIFMYLMFTFALLWCKPEND